MTVIYIPVIA